MRGLRRILAVAAAAALGGAVVVGAAAPAPSQAAGATLDKAGWWSRVQGPQPGEPDNPARPALAPVPAAPTGVPPDAIAVGASAGDAVAVAAFGVLIDPGVTVESLRLVVKESAQPGANVGAEQARVVACPITGFWGEARNANWVDRPEADCGRARAIGTRAADGTWTFDLSAMAALWADPASGLAQNGVLLAEDVEPPVGFRVAFLDASTGQARLEVSGASDSGDPAGDVGVGADGDAAGAPLAPVGSGDAGGLAGGGGSFTGAGDVVVSDGRARSAVLAGAPPGSGASTAGRPGSAGASDRGGQEAGRAASHSRVGDTVGNLSWLTFLLVPLGLAVALALGRSLAPDAIPAREHRAGGLSRALARRAAQEATER